MRKQDVKANRAQRKTGGGTQAGELAQQINSSPAMVAQRRKLNSLFGDAIQRQEAEDEPLQEKSDAYSTAQLKDEAATKPNNTGLPDNLKNGIESLSSMSMDSVKVHYNSSQPAQLNALAYAQGTDIHVAPGQEQLLPHEAWHVVQQAEGRVQPTMQMKDGVPINDDQSLEHEADVMGTKASSAGAAQKSTRFKPINFGMACSVQMAGHKGVMIFGNNGRLIKRIEENEYGQFEKIKHLQEKEQDRAHGVFPTIYRLWKGTDLGVSTVKEDYGNGQSVTDWLKKHKDTDYYVEMESFGGEGVDILDFKIGRETANEMELRKNYGKSEESAKKKVKKMSSVDDYSETAAYGLRDSDALQNEYWKGFNRWWGNYESTLDSVDERLKTDEKEFGRGKTYPEGSQALKDLKKIHQFILHSNTVYIASSLIMKWHKDRNERRRDRVVLIDLAHPVAKGMEGISDIEFYKIKHGMMLGILNLHAMLNGEKRSSRLQDVAVP